MPLTLAMYTLVEYFDLGANVACGTLLSSMTHILQFFLAPLEHGNPMLLRNGQSNSYGDTNIEEDSIIPLKCHVCILL